MYQVAETFNSVQGEGLYSGQMMTFIRFTKCSVGKTICHNCDTDFDRTYPWKGGGEFNAEGVCGLMMHQHVCFTGGEPMNVDLPQIMKRSPRCYHIETSGTVLPEWLATSRRYQLGENLRVLSPEGRYWIWLCVSPKPGFLEPMIDLADEVKVIVPGLGNGPGWPSLNDAVRWADSGKLVYLQPCNKKNEVDPVNLQLVLQHVERYPQLRLSPQLHKYLFVR